MELEIAAGIFWQDNLPLWEQTDEAQEAVGKAEHTAPVSQEKERCDSDNKRLSWVEYALGAFVLRITYNYTSAPDSKEWAGIKNTEYTVYAK
ncbi:hypothetical protein Q765_00150 [Flavobacterium rivuli WB 3.3-2 = DSM 21788]|uniref:Uncharacterized protein n=1 Tax=Flavobacterium rivuli WB 3.3-2 = DSM 21788 TaxID=1121895 RepID=A0A0A2MA79_9FLAO|nr:hypothetical protein [Flavobacterium rivuli]KGO88368.1 hypothetical protein Q765_00150 [Flavobacterium rivuli WB 3.3-2 = DSM 21788]